MFFNWVFRGGWCGGLRWVWNPLLTSITQVFHSKSRKTEVCWNSDFGVVFLWSSIFQRCLTWRCKSPGWIWGREIHQSFASIYIIWVYFPLSIHTRFLWLRKHDLPKPSNLHRSSNDLMYATYKLDPYYSHKWCFIIHKWPKMNGCSWVYNPNLAGGFKYFFSPLPEEMIRFDLRIFCQMG